MKSSAFLLTLLSPFNPTTSFVVHSSRRRYKSNISSTSPSSFPFSVLSSPPSTFCSERRRTNLNSCKDDDLPQPKTIDASLVKAAKIKLEWEVSEEMNSKPALDLSFREKKGDELFLSEQAFVARDTLTTKNTKEEEEEHLEEVEKERWEDGHVWFETCAELRQLGILPSSTETDKDDYSMWIIESVPQLLRLDTNMVLNTTQLLLSYGFDLSSISSSSSKTFLSILTYPPDSIQYAIESFLKNMMAAPSASFVLAVCKTNPELLLSGIQGGIQELTVKNALGKASDAMYSANQKVAVDSANVLKEIRAKNTKNM
mmetsp:Transcript_12034/g.17949  ORF Transcript_12034/g.17949 Transcript_12034/m.17949 type:complete len:315 (-) Transcript_12034:151-1095(-)